MTDDERVAARLAEQRHTYLDLDADSMAPCTDTRLCEHAHPLGLLDCPDCAAYGERVHEGLFTVVDGIEICRRCQMSWGVHGGGMRG